MVALESYIATRVKATGHDDSRRVYEITRGTRTLHRTEFNCSMRLMVICIKVLGLFGNEDRLQLILC